MTKKYGRGNVAVRLYATLEAPWPNLNANIWWYSQGNTGDVQVAFTSGTDVARTFTLTFVNGTVPAGGYAKIQMGVHKSDWSNFNQADDPSVPSGMSWADNSNVQMLQGGVMVWGSGSGGTSSPASSVGQDFGSLCKSIQENWTSIQAYHQEIAFRHVEEDAFTALSEFRKDCNAAHLTQISVLQAPNLERSLEKGGRLGANRVFREFAVPCINSCQKDVAETVLSIVHPDSVSISANKKILLQNIGIVPSGMYSALGLRGNAAKHILDSLGIKPDMIGKAAYLDLTGDTAVRDQILSEIDSKTAYSDLSRAIQSYSGCHDKQVQQRLISLWKSNITITQNIPSGGKKRIHIRSELANEYQRIYGNKNEYSCALGVTRNDLWKGAFRECNMRLAPGIPTPKERAMWDHLTRSWETFFDKCVGVKMDLTVPDKSAYFEDAEHVSPPRICPTPIE